MQFGGIVREAYLDFVPESAVGDYVIVPVGFAISKADAEEAERTYRLLENLTTDRGNGAVRIPRRYGFRPASSDAWKLTIGTVSLFPAG